MMRSRLDGQLALLNHKVIEMGASVQRLLKLEGLALNLDEHTVSIDGERVLLTYRE